MEQFGMNACTILAFFLTSSLSTFVSMSAIRAFIQKNISENNVMIFAKSYCPYCIKAKGLFDGMSVPFKSLDLDLMPEGAAIQAELKEMTGQSSVPNIFVKGQHVGGCDKVHDLHSKGELSKML